MVENSQHFPFSPFPPWSPAVESDKCSPHSLNSLSHEDPGPVGLCPSLPHYLWARRASTGGGGGGVGIC